MAQAVLCGYYGKGNSGDEALLATLLQMLPQSITPLVLSGNPIETQSRYGVRSCDRNSPLQVLQALQQSQYFIWGGGSLIQDATSAWSPLYYTGLMVLAQQLGLKTIAWAQGVGPLNRSTTRWLARHTFANCTKVSVRDRGSEALLSSWNVPTLVAPDPVWALEALPVKDLLDLPAPRVAVVLRPHPLLNSTRLGNLIQALVRFQKASQTSLLLLPFQPTQDRVLAQTIQSHLPGPSQVLCLDDPRAMKGIFREVDLAIAMRYHGLIMAAAEGCRCVALSYDPKVSQLMQELRLPGWDLADLPDQSQPISQLWLEHYQHGSALPPLSIQTLLDRACLHRNLLADVLASPM
jgi:polysaccharide pyruvyl transferase CsaB